MKTLHMEQCFFDRTTSSKRGLLTCHIFLVTLAVWLPLRNYQFVLQAIVGLIHVLHNGGAHFSVAQLRMTPGQLTTLVSREVTIFKCHHIPF